MATPTDPLYASQWHFPLLGDIEAIWDDYSGAGVEVAVYDFGVDYLHADLAGNYDASLHVVDDQNTPVDPFPVGDAAHGTACAGLIGAVEGNGLGGVGVAHGVTLTGVNIFDAGTYGDVNGPLAEFLDVLQQGARFDAISNSWGQTPGYSAGQNLNGGGKYDQIEQEYADLSALGRGGDGTLIVQAAGNDNRNANGSGLNASRHTVTVAATDAAGDAQSYTNYGSSILVAAPAGAVTTDISGAPGYTGGDYTTGFGGTSAATPVTTGVIALILEADPTLGWRDVHNILATSAGLTGSAIGGGATGFEDGAWFTTTQGNWNGGGHSFHPNYGFGMVDAYAAVRMAEVWSHFHDAPLTTANEEHRSGDSGTILLATQNNGTVTDTIAMADDIVVEDISVTIDFGFSYNGSILEIYLVAPDGTRFMLTDQESYFSTGARLEWTYGITGGLGMSSAGDWTIEITDLDGFGDTGTLFDWQIDFHGAPAGNDDTYHFTDDYLTMVAYEAARGTVSDTDGGTDWLNFSAIAQDFYVDLPNSPGAFGTIGPGPTYTPWGALSGDIENVVTGDGDDEIDGNALDNTLLGMRGDDRISGAGGSDVLEGGSGNDVLDGGSGDDVLDGGIGNDTVLFTGATATWVWLGSTELHDTGHGMDQILRMENATTGAGNDTLIGNSDANVLTAGAGNDALNGSIGNDVLDGGVGTDTVLFTGAFDTWVWLGTTEVQNTGYGLDTILRMENATTGVGNDTLIGNSDANVLTAGAGNDALNGSIGNDVLDGGVGTDTVLFTGAFDTWVWLGTTEVQNTGYGLDTILRMENATTGVGNDTLIGNSDANVLIAGAGNDTLNGAWGNDILDGGPGDDLLIGDVGSDVYIFRDGSGQDVVDGFEATNDDERVDLRGVSSIADFDDLNAHHMSQTGSDVLIDAGNGDTITMLDVALADLGPEDFTF